MCPRDLCFRNGGTLLCASVIQPWIYIVAFDERELWNWRIVIFNMGMEILIWTMVA